MQINLPAAPLGCDVRAHMTIGPDKLTEESARASALLAGKVVSRVIRNRPTEVGVEFADGARLFVDKSAKGLELSITGGHQVQPSEQAPACCFCSLTVGETPVSLSVSLQEDGTQTLWAHSSCLYARIHPTVPVLR